MNFVHNFTDLVRLRQSKIPRNQILHIISSKVSVILGRSHAQQHLETSCKQVYSCLCMTRVSFSGSHLLLREHGLEHLVQLVAHEEHVALDPFNAISYVALDHLVNVVLHVAVRNLVFVHHLFKLVAEELVLLLELSFDLADLLIDGGGDLFDATDPLVSSLFVLLRFNNVQEHIGLLLAAGLTNCASHIVHEVELDFGTVDLPVLDYTLKGVAHDGDEHVKHRQLSEECGTQEQDVAKGALGLVRIVSVVELAQRKEVLAESHIQEPVTEYRLHNLSVFSPVEVEHRERYTEEEQGDENEDDESPDIFQGLAQQNDVEACGVKDAQPVKHFCDHAKAGNCGHYAHVLHSDQVVEGVEDVA